MAVDPIKIPIEVEGDAAAELAKTASALADIDKASAAVSSQIAQLNGYLEVAQGAMRSAADPEEFIRAARAVDQISGALKRAEKEAAGLKKARAELDGTGAAARKAAEEIAAAGKAESDAAKAAEKATKQQAAATEKAAEKARELQKAGNNAANEFRGERMTAGAVALGNLLAKAAEEAVKFGIEIAKAFASMIIEADKANHTTNGLLKILASQTTGESVDSLKAKFAELAKQTGITTNQAVADFQKLRNRGLGLSLDEAFKLQRALADINATSGLGDDALKQFEEMRAKGISAASALETLKRNFQVAGDGSDAMKARTESGSAALEAAKNKVLELAGKMAEKLGPKIAEIADKFSAWLDKPENIDKISKAADSLANALVAAGQAFEWITSGSTSARAAIETFWGIVHSVTAFFGGPFVDAFNAGKGAIQSWGTSLTAIGEAVTKAYDAIKATVSNWTQMGSDLIQGFIDGIKAKIGEVTATVQGMADSVKATMAGALKIASPSKVFEEYGAFTSEGFAQGIEPVDVADEMGLSSLTGGPKGAPAPAANTNTSTSNSTNNITITVNASGGDPNEIAMAVREALNQYMAGMRASAGVGAAA